MGEEAPYFHWTDLNLSQNVRFFERVFRITNCDEFTRHFLTSQGVTIAQAEQIPLDNFSSYQAVKDMKINPPDFKEYKEYYEVKLGGGHPNNGLEKYLKNDRHVLSFDVMWRDKTLCGGINFYKMNYFLADDTIEVKEIRMQNSGKDPFPLLLKRGKVPKIPHLTHYPGMTLKKEEYYNPSDLICGKTIRIYNRECFIFNCDEFTKRYYKEKFGITQTPIELGKKATKKFYNPVPPYNGYGSEEDSLQNCYSLQPKPPKKNLNKMFNEDQYILRFEARLLSENREDNDRKFILNFYCGDDNIQVYLVTERNSGIQGGKYLEKAPHNNPITGKPYSEKDLQIGEVLVLNTQRFQILKADEFTNKFMQARPNLFPQSDVTYVMDRIRQCNILNWN